MKTLSSKDNPHVKKLAALVKQKKLRAELGLFVIEGARLCEDILTSGTRVVSAFVTPEAMSKYSGQANALVEKAENSYIISEILAHWVADTKNPQGLFAVCKVGDNFGREIMLERNANYLILDNIADPGNLGTILRTALAMDISAVFLSEDCAEVLSPKVLRGSMGGALKLKIKVETDLDETIKRFKKAGIKVYATTLNESSCAASRELFKNGGAVVLGNEAVGLSSERVELCDESVIIPMSENAESLNVGIAAGILMWEMKNGKVQEKE